MTSSPGTSCSRPGGSTSGWSCRPCRTAAGRARWRSPTACTRTWSRRSGGPAIERLWSHQAEALEAAWAGPTIVTTGTASGKSLCFNLPTLDVLSRDARARALYLYPAKALAQDQCRALHALGVKNARPAIYDGDTPREQRSAIRRRVEPRPHQPRHAAPGDPAQPRGVGRLPGQPRRGRGRRGARLPRRVRLARRQRAAPAAASGERLRDRAAVPARLGDDRQPRRAGRAAHRPRAVHGDRPRRLARAPAHDRDVEPADRRRGAGHAPLRARRGGRPAGRAGGRGRAHDRVHEVAQGGRADRALRHARARGPRAAGPGRADRALSRRLHAPAAARARAPARHRRAARRRLHRRARARHRHRLARRRDLRHVPRHRRVAAPDVGARRAPRARAGRLHRRRGRAGPVLLPPPGRVPRPPGRGGDPRPRERADPRRAPPVRRPRGAAGAARRGHARPVREHGARARELRRPAPAPRRHLRPAPARGLPGRGRRAALGEPRRGRDRRRRVGRAARQRRLRALVPRPSTRARSTCTAGARSR